MYYFVITSNNDFHLTLSCLHCIYLLLSFIYLSCTCAWNFICYAFKYFSFRRVLIVLVRKVNRATLTLQIATVELGLLVLKPLLVEVNLYIFIFPVLHVGGSFIHRVPPLPVTAIINYQNSLWILQFGYDVFPNHHFLNLNVYFHFLTYNFYWTSLFV